MFTAQDAAFADECLAALRPLPNDLRAAVALIDLPKAELRPRGLPPAPPLRAIDPALAAELDRFAAERLRAYVNESRTIWEYHDRDVFDPAIDTWATQRDWMAIAERHLDGARSHPMAVLILLDAGDPRGEPLAHQLVERAQPHHEASDAEIQIVWRFRHAYPDVARRWFAPQQFNEVPFAKARAALGDPVARRRLVVTAAAAMREVDDDRADAENIKQWPPDRQQLAHDAALRWARTDHHWSPPRTERLRVALQMGWRDVADALQENPYLVAGLLTHSRRSEQFDEPGMLMAKDFLLVWSRFAPPSTFLAQLLATAHTTDLLAMAERAARLSAANKPEVAKNLDSSIEIYRHWLSDMELGLAIAWTRCRGVIRLPA
jgi:hypothetical protein